MARREVPEQWLLGPTPPAGRWLMGYRDDGSCPFFEAGQCSIYAQRPRTCRDYDCRIYAAAGLLPEGDRPLIAQRVQAWEFSFPTAGEPQQAQAVRRAVRFVRSHAGLFPPQMRAHSPTAAAVLAVKVYPLFMQPEALPEPEALASLVVDAARHFDDD